LQNLSRRTLEDSTALACVAIQGLHQMRVRVCANCKGPSFHALCEDCEIHENASRKLRKKQPKDLTIYEPEHNGTLDAFDLNPEGLETTDY
jgi:hypothetical protein